MVIIFVMLLLMHENSLLLMRRSINSSFGAGLYSLPGGKVESREDALSAVIREASEEMGIEVQASDVQLVHTLHRKGPENDLVLLFFKTDTWQGVPCNKEPEKCDEFGWFDIDALPENMIPAHRQGLELIQQKISYSQHGW